MTEEQGVYDVSHRHIGEQDSIISIVEEVKQGRPRERAVMVIVAAGMGWGWGAACVRWGPCDT